MPHIEVQQVASVWEWPSPCGSVKWCEILLRSYALLIFFPLFKTGLQFPLEFFKCTPTPYVSNWQKMVLEKELHHFRQQKFKTEWPFKRSHPKY